MNAYSPIPVETDYSPEFLTALASIAKDSEDHWNAQAAKQQGELARWFRNRALEYGYLRHDALSALEGCDESISALNEYFDTDHLLLWREVEKAA